MRRIKVDEEIAIWEPTVADAPALFDLIDGNREHLRQGAPWPDSIKTVDDMRARLEIATSPAALARVMGGVVEFHGTAVGMLMLHGLDSLERATELDFWLTEDAQGKGIITRACRTLMGMSI